MRGRVTYYTSVKMKSKSCHKVATVFRFSGRTFTLNQRERGRWHLRVKIRGRQRRRTFHTSNPRQAVALAKDWIAGLTDAPENPEESTLEIPTFRELITTYHLVHRCKDMTVKNNLRMLGRLLSEGLGKEKWLDLPIDHLDENCITRFIASRQGLTRPNYVKVYMNNLSTNSTVAQALSIFGDRLRIQYARAGWLIPESLVKSLRFERVKEHHVGFRPIPEETMAAMARAIEKEKAAGNLEMWLVNKMILHLGLRCSELIAARRSWVETSSSSGVVKHYLHVKHRPEEGFETKNGKHGRIGIPDWLWEEIKDREGYLVNPDGGTNYMRYKLIYETHSKWLRKFIPERQKSNHELRKQGGSLVALKYNSFEVAARFLRDSLETAKEHYLELIEPVCLDDIDL